MHLDTASASFARTRLIISELVNDKVIIGVISILSGSVLCLDEKKTQCCILCPKLPSRVQPCMHARQQQQKCVNDGVEKLVNIHKTLAPPFSITTKPSSLSDLDACSISGW